MLGSRRRTIDKSKVADGPGLTAANESNNQGRVVRVEMKKKFWKIFTLTAKLFTATEISQPKKLRELN